MNNEKLKPCPFCGGKAYIGATEHFDGADKFFAYCLSCLVHTTLDKSDRAAAITAWNTRAEPTVTFNQTGNNNKVINRVGTLNVK